MNFFIRILSIFSIFTIVTFSTQSFAAKPLSIKFIEDVIAGDRIYSHYIVMCSNGSQRDLSAWDNRSIWCEGKGSKTRCNKKQLKTAKNACERK